MKRKTKQKKKGLSPFRHDGQSKISLHATIRSGGEGFRQENTLKKKKTVFTAIYFAAAVLVAFFPPLITVQIQKREREKKKEESGSAKHIT